MSGINSYDVGDEIELRAAYTNQAGAPSNPATVTLTITKPDGTAVEGSTPINTGTGTYHFTLIPEMGGLWRHRWVSTGDPTTEEEGVFFVRRREG